MKKTEMIFDKEILNQAIKTYGYDLQINQLFEEMAELQKEVCKARRGFDNKSQLLEELADVYIMLEQLKIMKGISSFDIQGMIDYKMERLKKRLENSYELE